MGVDGGPSLPPHLNAGALASRTESALTASASPWRGLRQGEINARHERQGRGVMVRRLRMIFADWEEGGDERVGAPGSYETAVTGRCSMGAVGSFWFRVSTRPATWTSWIFLVVWWPEASTLSTPWVPAAKQGVGFNPCYCPLLLARSPAPARP